MEKRKYNAMLLESKQTTKVDKVNQCNKDDKQLFRLVNEITSSTKDNPLPDGLSNQELADQFADYFINKIQLIRDSLDNDDKYHAESTSHTPTLGKFEPLMEDEVAKNIIGMASKSCESDLVPTTLLKETLPQFIRLINEMLPCFKKWFNPLLTYMGLQMITLLRTVLCLTVTLKQKEM